MILLLCKREILSGTAAHLSFVVDAQRAPAGFFVRRGQRCLGLAPIQRDARVSRGEWRQFPDGNLGG